MRVEFFVGSLLSPRGFLWVFRFSPLLLKKKHPIWNPRATSLGPGSLLGDRAKKIEIEASRAGSGEGEEATEPGDMPLMQPIRPPVISCN